MQDYGEPSRNVYSINNIRYDRLFLSTETPRSQEAMTIQVERAHGLEALGIVRSGHVHWNLSPAALYEEALRRGEGQLAADGPLVARTGQHTGRSPNDKFVVREPRASSTSTGVP
jgi:phosphoenolpyruvate carboxykinase (ATP)